jgi:hypothetical protein
VLWDIHRHALDIRTKLTTIQEIHRQMLLQNNTPHRVASPITNNIKIFASEESVVIRLA